MSRPFRDDSQEIPPIPMLSIREANDSARPGHAPLRQPSSYVREVKKRAGEVKILTGMNMSSGDGGDSTGSLMIRARRLLQRAGLTA